jgi:hypothetical protein
VPSIEGPSSSLVSRKAMRPGTASVASSRSQAVTIAARLPFMSAAPRPCSMPLSMRGSKGGCVHAASGPGGTTSVWPANTNSGPSLPRTAQRLSTSP